MPEGNVLDMTLLAGMLVTLQVGAINVGGASSARYVSVLMIHMVVMSPDLVS